MAFSGHDDVTASYICWTFKGIKWDQGHVDHGVFLIRDILLPNGHDLGQAWC